MRTTLSLAVLGGLLLVGTVPAEASTWPVVFNNYCTIGSYRICASSNVRLIDGKTLEIDFWNNERVNSAADINGQSSTITAVGLYHYPAIETLELSAKPTFSVTLMSTLGLIRDLSSYWKLGASDIGTIGSVQLDELAWEKESEDLGGSTKTGHKGGIVGCNDPGVASHEHASTCLDAANDPFVRFTFSFADDISGKFTAANLNMRFHAQQINPLDEDDSVKCDTRISSGEHACLPPTSTVPEPMSMALLGTGLMGIAGAARRRRQKEHAAE